MRSFFNKILDNGSWIDYLLIIVMVSLSLWVCYIAFFTEN